MSTSGLSRITDNLTSSVTQPQIPRECKIEKALEVYLIENELYDEMYIIKEIEEENGWINCVLLLMKEPLFYWCLLNDKRDIIKIIIEYSLEFDVLSLSAKGENIVSFAVSSGCFPVLEYVLALLSEEKRELLFMHKRTKCLFPLSKFVKEDSLKISFSLLQLGYDFHEASFIGDLAQDIKQLVQSGKDIEISIIYFQQIISFMLDKGYDFGNGDSFERTTLPQLLCLYNLPPFLETFVLLIAKMHSLEEVQAILTKRGGMLTSPLIICCQSSSSEPLREGETRGECVKIILDAGVNPNIVTRRVRIRRKYVGIVPLSYCISSYATKSQEQVACLLLDRGADPSQAIDAFSSKTFVHRAVIAFAPKIVLKLLEMKYIDTKSEECRYLVKSGFEGYVQLKEDHEAKTLDVMYLPELNFVMIDTLVELGFPLEPAIRNLALFSYDKFKHVLSGVCARYENLDSIQESRHLPTLLMIAVLKKNIAFARVCLAHGSSPDYVLGRKLISCIHSPPRRQIFHNSVREMIRYFSIVANTKTAICVKCCRNVNTRRAIITCTQPCDHSICYKCIYKRHKNYKPVTAFSISKKRSLVFLANRMRFLKKNRRFAEFHPSLLDIIISAGLTEYLVGHLELSALSNLGIDEDTRRRILGK